MTDSLAASGSNLSLACSAIVIVLSMLSVLNVVSANALANKPNSAFFALYCVVFIVISGFGRLLG
jgi:hypothetical protein